MFELSPHQPLTLDLFEQLMQGKFSLAVSQESIARLHEVRRFIEKLLQSNAAVYGLTTGFADLRNKAVSPDKASELSRNIIESHDAGIGTPLSEEIVLGAMIIRANALAKGYSGFQEESLQTLVNMINARIIPEIPSCGSLGASGDLALLARLGRAMMGEDVPVFYRGAKISAKQALALEGITPFSPKAKEGLALTNGTSFMASMGAIALLREASLIENILALQPLFLESVHAVDAAFADPIHQVRGQEGQSWISSILYNCIRNSPYIDRNGIQNDYCIRCIPQILGPKIESFCNAVPWIERELDAVTDNPLIFKGEFLGSALAESRILVFEQECWSVLSGGNFHGEYLTTAADTIALSNAKIVLLLERQMTYMLNPFRNQSTLSPYLIAKDKDAGLLSGYMITQYTGNDLAQRIAAFGVPTGIYNITSANESEDVVSYGSTACQRLLSQISLLEDFVAIYLTIAMQAYSLRRKTQTPDRDTYSERLFAALQTEMGIEHPYTEETSFIERYAAAKKTVLSSIAGQILGSPLSQRLKDKRLLAAQLSTIC